MKPEDVTIYFVLQRGPLSLQGRLLAFSIREFLGPKVNVRAAIPRDFPEPNRDTLVLMEHLGVEVEYFVPEIARKYQYKIGNKLDASRLAFKTEYAMFLDTDTLFLRPVDLEQVFANKPEIAAQKIMGRGAYFGESGKIFRQYAQDEFDIETVPLSDESKLRPEDICGFPIYNAGAVLYRTDTSFAEDWCRVTEQILEANLPEKLKRPYADQSALALVMAGAKYASGYLPAGWNAHPTARRNAILAHYFNMPTALAFKHIGEVIVHLREAGTMQGFDPMEEWAGRDIKFFKDKWE